MFKLVMGTQLSARSCVAKFVLDFNLFLRVCILQRLTCVRLASIGLATWLSRELSKHISMKDQQPGYWAVDILFYSKFISL